MNSSLVNCSEAVEAFRKITRVSVCFEVLILGASLFAVFFFLMF